MEWKCASIRLLCLHVPQGRKHPRFTCTVIRGFRHFPNNGIAHSWNNVIALYPALANTPNIDSLERTLTWKYSAKIILHRTDAAKDLYILFLSLTCLVISFHSISIMDQKPEIIMSASSPDLLFPSGFAQSCTCPGLLEDLIISAEVVGLNLSLMLKNICRQLIVSHTRCM